jgi:hypothetical protein
MTISTRNYILMTIGMGLLVFLIGLAAGDDIAQWAREQQAEAAARNLGLIEKVVFVPVEFVFDTDNSPWGAILAALVWPLAILWLVLVVIGIIIITVVEAKNAVPEDRNLIGYLGHLKFLW